MAPASRPMGSRSTARGTSRDRHGRGGRGPVTGPDLPPLITRAELFETTVSAAAEYLTDLWPDELGDVSFEVAAIPSEESPASGMSRWLVLPAERRVILYRLPIERLAKLNRSDVLHRRMLVESCVFRAVAELLGKDPWELAPDRFRHL